MYINERKNLFHKPNRASNPYLIMLILLCVVIVAAVMRDYASGKIWPPFIPTPTPTRTVNSFLVEGDTHFQAGNLDAAIDSYNKAILLEPENIDLRVKLARIQVYSSASLTTDQERRDRLADALAIVDEAREKEPNNADVLAIRSLVLNWSANPTLAGERTTELRNAAEADALAAIQLDSRNALAKAYYAEVLIDQFKWGQAQDYIAQARQNGEDLMDVRRVQAFVYEVLKEYNLAIEWYQKAIDVNPNLTFLYIRVGTLYRHIGGDVNFEIALEYFAKAANLNSQLGIDDPIPYMAIANTYIRMGEAMIASRNAYRALSINPYNPATYGQVGFIYYRARNYEGAEMVLKCAVIGCTAEESCLAREEDPCESNITTEALPLSDTTVVYYYIYGSVLAGLHRKGQDDRCAHASEVFKQIRDVYYDTSNEFTRTVLKIVSASEGICGITPGQVFKTPVPTPDLISTPTPQPTETPFIIPTITPTP
jgi:tetratricopeptide (TPR) repeat protein